VQSEAKPGGIVVQESAVESDGAAITKALSSYLNPHADEARFDWLYRRNPHGTVRVWTAVDTTRGAVVGVAAAFPRRIYVGEREATVWVLGDFCVDPRYRSLGLALKLQKTCLAAANSAAVPFCYDFPNIGMMAVYRRLGVVPFGEIIRFARPLTVNRQVNRMIKLPVLAAGFSAIGNLFLKLYSLRNRKDRALTTFLHVGRCGEEFSALCRGIRGRFGLFVQRSAEYLNWRYLDNTYQPHEILTARKRGSLVAYAVFIQAGENGSIVDLVGSEDAGVLTTLIEAVVALLKSRGVNTISVPMFGSHPWVPLLRGLGFMPRESKPVVVHCSPPFLPEMVTLAQRGFFLMQGDRDS
jgi:GNAT superfamily N-acetyltransferase